SYIRDALVGGELLTVQQVAEGTGVEGSKIWEFIHDGYIDLARFDDPDVRSYLVQKRLDQERAMRERRKSTEQAKSPPDLKKGKDRYHRKDKRGD
ncbi:hypothetical protein IIA79_07305, partial [bacterium]|nr:hypothetical protein [bacterium]